MLSADFAVVGEVSDGEGAMELVRELQPDVDVLDLAMPDKGGIATVRKITASGGHSAVVMLSVLDDPALVLDASKPAPRATSSSCAQGPTWRQQSWRHWRMSE
ncbi:MAG TPA: response regulator transcription factor [Gemmatimonadales bacterium]|nr:response regulator transcription factor [Gemmatimonadales bacterium]